MRTLSLALAASLFAACAAPSSPVPAPSTSPAVARDAFFDALARNEEDDALARKAEDDALAALARAPALANARNAKGRSAFTAALGRRRGNSFVRPQNNRVLAAILAHHPALDDFEVAAAGDLARIETLTTQDSAYVRRVHTTGWTPLHFAAFAGQTRVVGLLLARGAEVDAPAQNRFGNTPLQVALLTDQCDVARELLLHHADVNFRQKEGVTALHEAVIEGDAACVRMLLDAGADPN